MARNEVVLRDRQFVLRRHTAALPLAGDRYLMGIEDLRHSRCALRERRAAFSTSTFTRTVEYSVARLRNRHALRAISDIEYLSAAKRGRPARSTRSPRGRAQ